MRLSKFYIPSVQRFRSLYEDEIKFYLRKCGLTDDQIWHTSDNWRREFRRRLYTFYRSERMTLEFSADKLGVSLNYKPLEESLRAYGELAAEFRRDSDDILPMTILDVVDGAPMIDYLKAQCLGEFTPWKYSQLLYQCWFDDVAVGKAKSYDVSDLRSMSYAEYLNTDHWRRIRCAMLIAYDARCNRAGCDHSLEAHYFGDQADLHVHHKTYENRGHERFDDLELLCALCHQKEHAA